MAASTPSAIKPAATLVEEIARVYEVGPGYASAYLQRWAVPGSLPDGIVLTDLRELADVRALREPFPIWFDFAMSTNQRARSIAALLTPELAPGARRFLDIGCGFGGLLVAFAKAGFEVVGIELDPERVALSEANLLDHALAERVFRADLLADADAEQGSGAAPLRERFGSFDAICMIDVIEHVLDARAALARATSLLAPGGVLLLEIPNPEHVGFVARDGHFELFGITLLDRARAIDLHRAFFSFPYDVGDYHSLAFYQEALRDLGLSSAVVNSPLHPAAPLGALDDLVAALHERRATELERYARGGVAEALTAEIERRVDGYLRDLQQERAGASPSSERAAELSLRYLTPFWTLIVRKPASGSRPSTDRT